MKTDNRVLYFSLNPTSIEGFYKCIDDTGFDSQCSFRAIDREDVFDKDGKALKFKHASDLLYFLKTFGDNEDLGYLYVIIDFPSFFNLEKHCSFVELEKTNELESFSVDDASKIIRRAILQYPEVFFMFDESWNHDEEKLWYPSFLFDFEAEKYFNGVWAEYHKYAIRPGENPFYAILRGRSNLFDGSNLRYALKRFEYEKLIVERYNFSLVQDSRANHLAICVEEERVQNRFNSYVLFANGFRVLPVFSSKDLKDINANAPKLNPDLIIRDYDLQFSDVDDKKTPITIQKKETYNIHTIDYIRGAKYIKRTDNDWNNTHPEDSEQLIDDKLKYLNKWYVPHDNNEHLYWDKFGNLKEKVFFVSKGVGDRIRFFPSTADYRREREQELSHNNITEAETLGLFVDGISRQIMRGTTKPVSGIYTTFRRFETIKERYEQFRIIDKQHFIKKHSNDKEKSQQWYIDTSRQNSEHGVPLNFYDMVRNMLDRALKYYNTGKYIRSAIISSEVIEVLNGFHETLVLQAYHVLAISENALAMNAIGGNEEELSLDANFRITKIASEVERLMDREGDDRRKLRYNTLNQIFSDCRAYCQEKKHFKAENRFISAMAHLNEGYTYNDIFHTIKDFALYWASTIQQFVHVLQHTKKN